MNGGVRTGLIVTVLSKWRYSFIKRIRTMFFGLKKLLVATVLLEAMVCEQCERYFDLGTFLRKVLFC